MPLSLRFLVFLSCTPWWLAAQRTVEVRPLTDRIIVLYIDEGDIDFHGNGEDTGADVIMGIPVDSEAIDKLENYGVKSTDDPNYSAAQRALSMGRKSKGTDFANYCDAWGDLPFYGLDGCQNTRVDHLKQHWIYLNLPQALQAGKTYTVEAFVDGTLDQVSGTFTFDPKVTRSDAIHVNNIGYQMGAELKMGYVYHWRGTDGGLDVDPLVGRTFGLVDAATEEVVFTGTLRFRVGAGNHDTNRAESFETPGRNFLGSAVAEGDFSNFNEPGNYRFYVEGVGASYPFTIACNALRPAHVATLRGLYHNRSGIALEKPYTDWTRPAPHNPQLTPGFAGKFVYTSTTYCSVEAADNNSRDRDDWDAGVRGALEDTWGWYQDAGDWDGYLSHFDIPTKLLFTYEHFPENFADEDLNIPGSGNGIPDILDEARWLVRFYKRAKDETEAKGWTTGGVPGGRIMGDLWGSDLGEAERGRGSWQDNDRRWILSGEDPVTTYKFVAGAAHLAYLLQRDGFTDPENINWIEEAETAFQWAEQNYRSNYDCHNYDIRDARAYAAATLLRLTDEPTYDDAFRDARRDRRRNPAQDGFEEREGFGPYIYVTLPNGDAGLKAGFMTAIENAADFILLTPGDQRGLRWGGNMWFPMLVGQGTTPMVWEGIMGYALLREQLPTKAARYRRILHATADYFLGSNPLNMTWITGLGEKSPERIFDLDSRYNIHDFQKPGVTPYGPWRDLDVFGNLGTWNFRWANQTLTPAIDDWPGHERWFSNRYSPLTGEFTVWQNGLNAAVLYGILAGEADCAKSPNAIPQRTLRKEVRIFPNPVAAELRFTLPEGRSRAELLRILDPTGRVVQSMRQPGTSISVAELPAGIYFLEVRGQGYVATGRFMVQR